MGSWEVQEFSIQMLGVQVLGSGWVATGSGAYVLRSGLVFSPDVQRYVRVE